MSASSSSSSSKKSAFYTSTSSTKSTNSNYTNNNPLVLAIDFRNKMWSINHCLVTIFLIAVVTLSLSTTLSNMNQVQALNCYHCSSIDDPGCDEPFTGRANFTDTDCEKRIGKPAKVCRKIVQYIEHKKVVLRSCGYIDEHEDKGKKPMCYKRSGTFALMMESCICYEDNCNHSANLVPSSKLLTTMSAIVSIIFYYFKFLS